MAVDPAAAEPAIDSKAVDDGSVGAKAGPPDVTTATPQPAAPPAPADDIKTEPGPATPEAPTLTPAHTEAETKPAEAPTTTTKTPPPPTAPPSQTAAPSSKPDIDAANPLDFHGTVNTNNDLPSPETLAKIGDYMLLDRDGKSHPFRSLYSGKHVARRVLIIFVRHFFCGVRPPSPPPLPPSLTPHRIANNTSAPSPPP